MMIGALHPYETSLRSKAPLELVATDGRTVTLDIERYLAPCDEIDINVIDRCGEYALTRNRSSVLDVGCGPGRMVHALAARGVAALGIDIAATAVDLTRARGAAALVRDLYARLPGEGRWGTALVLDGNVGIGGDVDRLLLRLGTLLAHDGCAIIETAPDEQADERMEVRFSQHGDAVGPTFGWAVIGAQSLARRAQVCGFSVYETWSAGGRTFVELERSRLTLSA
jgi:SAM-dependent methyltransferase